MSSNKELISQALGSPITRLPEARAKARPMRWKDVGDFPCSVARTLAVVGDRWTLLILRDAFLGTRRFDLFQRHLGISRHRLSDRLSRLVDGEILERHRYQERPERFEYRLTDKGRDLYPVILSLNAWGDRWMSGDEGPPWEMRHAECGHTGAPQLMCAGCGEPASPREYRFEPSAWLRERIERARTRERVSEDEESAQRLARDG